MNQEFPPSQPVACGEIDGDGLKNFLQREGFPRGLYPVVLDNLRRLPIRFIIADDSGSMMTNDGHRVIIQGHQTRVIPCSRWSELIEGLKFHAQLANAAKAVTEFRFLNGSGPILVGQANDSGVGISTAMTVFSTMSPNGGTPLCRHISAVVDQIRILEPQLRASGQKAVVVIATDGESSDGNIADALKPLQHLPALVVVRLCTDAENICNYWNNVDAELELALDVLDDLKGEAEEVYGTNNWLTYAEPLHRLREFGMILKEFDLLDETKLSHDQMKLMCSLLVGDGHPSELPDPAMDWESFYKFVKDRSKASNMVYSPLKNKLQPWIDLKKLKANYGPGGDGCCIS